MTFTVRSTTPKGRKWDAILTREFNRFMTTPTGKKLMEETWRAFEKAIKDRILYGK